MQQLAFAICVEERRWASKIFHEQKIEIRTWTLPKYEGATIGIAVAGTNAVYGQAKLVRFEQIDIKAFKSKDWQAKHHIHPSDKYWQNTVEAFKNGKHVYGWHFADPLAYQEPVGFTNRHGRVSRHPLGNDALYKANVQNLQLGLPMQPGKMMKRSQVRGAALSGDVVVNAWANAHGTAESEEDDEAVKAEVKGKAQAKGKATAKVKAKLKGKTQGNIKGMTKAKAKAKVSARHIIEELEGRGLNEKEVRTQALARGVSKARLWQLRPRSRPTAESFVQSQKNVGASSAGIRTAMKELGFCDAMVRTMMKRPAAAAKPAAIR